jgi:hypothetical protein
MMGRSRAHGSGGGYRQRSGAVRCLVGRVLLAVSFGVFVLGAAVAAQAPVVTEPPRAASLDAAAWLVGHWVGTTATGQHIEEMWMPAVDGHMLGSFRWARADGRWLFELLALDTQSPPADGTPLVLRIKHFDRALRGMEEKGESTTLRLESHGPDRLMFAMTDGARTVRVGYTRQDADHITGIFEEVVPDKPAVRLEFPYTRAGRSSRAPVRDP